MTTPPVRLSADARRFADTILSDPGRVAGLLGEFGDDDTHSTTGDPISRVRELFDAIEGSIEVVVANAEEIGDPEYRTQAEGEVIASLITLREIWYRFPELWGRSGGPDGVAAAD